MSAQYMGLLTAKLVTILPLLCFSAETVFGAQNFEAQYSSFNDSNKDNFAIQSPAAISNDALQITPDTASNSFNLYNWSGRVLLNRTFKLWDDKFQSNNSARSVVSFDSSFLINIYRLNNSAAAEEWLAFVIVPDKAIHPGSEGQYMGLINSTTDGNSTNRLVAVEFNTFKQDFDPDNNHIGLNINSVRSKIVEGAKFYNVWVQYDGFSKNIMVYIAEKALKDGPTPDRPDTPVLQSYLDLRDVVAQYSYFGFAASTGNNAVQLNCVLTWNLTVEYHLGNNKKHPSSGLIIVLGSGVSLLVIAAIVFWYTFWWPNQNMNPICESKTQISNF